MHTVVPITNDNEYPTDFGLLGVDSCYESPTRLTRCNTSFLPFDKKILKVVQKVKQAKATIKNTQINFVNFIIAM